MFQELINQKNDAMLSGGVNFFYMKLGITKEEQALISFEEVKESDSTSGICAGLYKEGKLIKINIKIVKYASIIGMLDVLAHELVHARQHLRGEFYFERVMTPVFFGLFNLNLLHKFHKGQDLHKTPYYDRFCEQEAHKMSHDLIVEFLSLIKTVTDSKEFEEPIVCPI